MKKRGVSPLIASVLLIAFTIMLFVLISTWVRRAAIEPTMQTGEEKLGGALECMNTKVDIVNVCKQIDTKLKIDIDNIGDTTLTGVKIRAISDEKVSELESFPADATTPYNIAPYNRIPQIITSKIIITVEFKTNLKVEVYPETKGGVCRDAMVSKLAVACST